MKVKIQGGAGRGTPTYPAGRQRGIPAEEPAPGRGCPAELPPGRVAALRRLGPFVPGPQLGPHGASELTMCSPSQPGSLALGEGKASWHPLLLPLKHSFSSNTSAIPNIDFESEVQAMMESFFN